MKIKIDFWVIPMMLLTVFINEVDIYLISISLIIIHEMGHVIVAKIFKYKIMEFKIFALGAQASICENEIKIGNIKNRFKKILIDSAGIITNLLIIVLVIYLKDNVMYYQISNIYLKKIYIWMLMEYPELIYINIALIGINMLPIYPLDGGRIVKNIFDMYLGKEKALDYIEEISRIGTYTIILISSILIMYFQNIFILFFVIFILYLRYKEIQIYKIKKRVYFLLRKDKEDSIKYMENTCKSHKNVLK